MLWKQTGLLLEFDAWGGLQNKCDLRISDFINWPSLGGGAITPVGSRGREAESRGDPELHVTPPVWDTNGTSRWKWRVKGWMYESEFRESSRSWFRDGKEWGYLEGGVTEKRKFWMLQDGPEKDLPWLSSPASDDYLFSLFKAHFQSLSRAWF